MQQYADAFEGELDQVVNRKKTFVAADQGPVAKWLEAGLKDTGVPVVDTGKLLGAGLATKYNHGRGVARGRYRMAASRRRRFRGLTRAGAKTWKVTGAGTNKQGTLVGVSRLGSF